MDPNELAYIQQMQDQISAPSYQDTQQQDYINNMLRQLLGSGGTGLAATSPEDQKALAAYYESQAALNSPQRNELFNSNGVDMFGTLTSMPMGYYNDKPVYWSGTTERGGGVPVGENYYGVDSSGNYTTNTASKAKTTFGESLASALSGGITDALSGDAPGSSIGADFAKYVMPIVNPGVVSGYGVVDSLENGDWAKAINYLVDPVTEPGIDMLARGSGDVIGQVSPEIQKLAPVLGTVIGTVAGGPWGALAGYEIGNKIAGGSAEQGIYGGAAIGATAGAGSLLSGALSGTVSSAIGETAANIGSSALKGAVGGALAAAPNAIKNDDWESVLTGAGLGAVIGGGSAGIGQLYNSIVTPTSLEGSNVDFYDKYLGDTFAREALGLENPTYGEAYQAGSLPASAYGLDSTQFTVDPTLERLSELTYNPENFGYNTSYGDVAKYISGESGTPVSYGNHSLDYMPKLEVPSFGNANAIWNSMNPGFEDYQKMITDTTGFQLNPELMNAAWLKPASDYLTGGNAEAPLPSVYNPETGANYEPVIPTENLSVTPYEEPDIWDKILNSATNYAKDLGDLVSSNLGSISKIGSALTASGTATTAEAEDVLSGEQSEGNDLFGKYKSLAASESAKRTLLAGVAPKTEYDGMSFIPSSMRKYNQQDLYYT